MSATTAACPRGTHPERPTGNSQLRKDNEMSDVIAPHAFLNMASISQTILGKIVAAKQEWVAARKLAQPLESFQSTLTPSDRDFVGALKAGSTRFILECKKASPSKGLIRNDFSPEAIADIYGKYATAISVLTDEKFFQGDFAFLPRVRARVSQPVLCKDFMIDPYQLYLARHYQADAILLMLSVLTDEGYRALKAVIDSGQMRVPKFSPRSGMTRLETVRVSQASADQRAGRAVAVPHGRKSPHIQGFAGGGVAQRFQRALKHRLVEGLGARHVLHIDLEPAHGVVLHAGLLAIDRWKGFHYAHTGPRRTLPSAPGCPGL